MHNPSCISSIKNRSRLKARTHPQPVEMLVAAHADRQGLGLARQLHVQHVRDGLPDPAERLAGDALPQGL